LQTALQAKAKAEPSYRFYNLWDKIYREDVLWEAYRRCRVNDGVPGADRVTFQQIEAEGVKAWLAKLQEELRSKTYCPGPLLRVWIPKSNGGERPLSIPAIRDRVTQMAMLLVISPIFEADLCPEQYGFRPGMDAKMAIRRAYFHVAQHGLREVVDADLSDYFNTIPHGALMRCLSRRISGTRHYPMIAARDIGRVGAARLASRGWIGHFVGELHGPADLSFDEVAGILSQTLDRKVEFVTCDREDARRAMLENALSENAADLMLEMYDAVENGKLQTIEPRSTKTTTPTTLTEFARDVMLPRLLVTRLPMDYVVPLGM